MKHEPLFLTFAEIIEIHDYQIEHFGGGEGLRDIELLKSAIGMPSATFGGEYLHPTILEMAAAYLYHLVENHPFVDGNASSTNLDTTYSTFTHEISGS